MKKQNRIQKQSQEAEQGQGEDLSLAWPYLCPPLSGNCVCLHLRLGSAPWRSRVGTGKPSGELKLKLLLYYPTAWAKDLVFAFGNRRLLRL